ncbi:MAG: leucine--tRNA ligase [Bacteroidia bacterium]
MDYNFRDIEAKWQRYWRDNHTYRTVETPGKKKYYVLDMFPYPSGAGLHVGHPLGYIASDIVSRYKRLRGFNVLHPMGYDAFGLPAEQYAIQTGQHPKVTTEQNIRRYREQLDKIGFSYDWEREIRTCEPDYYRWTQWIFIQLFHAWFNCESKKAEPISSLVKVFETEGFVCSQPRFLTGDIEKVVGPFTAAEWKAMSEKEKSDVLLHFRLAYLSDAWVNWCPALGTVLANDEVKDGVSERGGYPVERKMMKQWSLRITAYADRLLHDLDTLDWPESVKEAQRNWIGKSEGTSIRFKVVKTSSGAIKQNHDSQNNTGSFTVAGTSPQHSPEENRDPVAGASPQPSPEEREDYFFADPKTYKYLKEFAKANRKEQTPSEAKLWEALRNSNLGYKFRRQVIIGNYIADFACFNPKLVIEVDGGIHLTAEQKEKDANKNADLNFHNFSVIRVTDKDVLENVEIVVDRILKTINKIESSSPSPLERGPGGEALGSEVANTSDSFSSPSPLERGPGGEVSGGFGEVEDWNDHDHFIEVFTTRPDTIFGVSFVTLAPEHELVNKLTTDEYRHKVEEYVKVATNKSERERQAEVKKVSGQFTGAHVIHPFTGEHIPVWIGEYVLAGYGTGAVMAVPGHDQRDYLFAKHFHLPVKEVVAGGDLSAEAYTAKDGKLVNSGFLNGLEVKQAIREAITEIEKLNIGKGQVNYRLRDAAFGRQRYWGEPIPVYYKDGVPHTLEESELPLILPEIDKFQPTETGEPPLARAANWKYKGQYEYEHTTMPGWAGSSWYFLRYMDAKNRSTFVSEDAVNYWQQVDFYLGGAEHATGHLLYVRFWTKFLYDMGYIPVNEPAKKLINQGMIQGVSAFVYRVTGTHQFVSHGLKDQYQTTPLHVDVSIAPNHILDLEKFKAWREDFADATFVLEDGVYKCGAEVEKMSKSKYNVVNPDDIIEEYGADTLRLYEMFLGPLEQSKPWSTQGINGVHNFLRRLWRMYNIQEGKCVLSDDAPSPAELKVLHKTIKKVEEDVERFSFNTTVSAFMICLNELYDLKCNKRAILEPLVIILSPYAPHFAEELWSMLGHTSSVTEAIFPQWKEEYLVENEFEYPVSINGKVKFKINLSLQLSKEEVEANVLSSEEMKKLVQGAPKKVIVVPGRIVNVVV